MSYSMYNLRYDPYYLLSEEERQVYDLLKEERDKKIVPGEYLHIMAPINKLNTYGMRHVSYKLVPNKDPIVLQPVNDVSESGRIDGYLIIAAWGLEASDDKVANANHN